MAAPRVVGWTVVEGSGTLEELLVDLDEFALVVEGPHRAHVVAALRAAGEALSHLPATALATAPWVSAPAPLPQGPAVRVNDLSTRAETRRRAAEVIRATLDAHEIDPCTATVAPVDGLDDLDSCPRAVVLRLFPRPARAVGIVDPVWIDVASEWVFGDLAAGAAIRMRILGVEVDVDVAEAAGVLHGCARARTWCDVLSGDVASRIRTASLSFGDSPHVAIGAGGPRCDDDGLLARFGLLREVAAELAGTVAYACVDFEETFGGLGTGLVGTEWSVSGGAPSHLVAGRLVDRFVPEAFPVQVLAPRHVTRLRAADPSVDVGTELADERWLLSLGDPVDWLPTAGTRGEARADGWDRLRPLLVADDELDEADAPGDDEAGPEGEGTLHPDDGELGAPALDDVVIEATPHNRRGSRLTVLELAAWLAGEPHGDAPRSVSPVVATFARHLSAGLGAERRQELRHLAGDLVGSGPAQPVLEHHRTWLLVHWLAGRHAGAWLRSAGLAGSAERLARVLWPLDDTELVRTVELLGSAIATAGRRTEITLTMADDRATDVEELAWEAWEIAAERSGWVAASEAIGRDLPPDLVDGVDQRVIEGSRDPRARAELEASRRSIGDAAWTAALHETATAAWRAAWDEMETYVHHESTFSVRTTIRRSLEDRLGPDTDALAVDALIDDVDAVARGALARQLLAGEAVQNAWKRALDAAQAAEAGPAWCEALADTRRVLGETLYDDAVAIGQDELRRHLDDGPERIGQAVAAAIAREAAGVAGRSVAARAAAGVFAGGGNVAEARAAATGALEPVVAELADEAIALLAALVTADAP